MTTIGIIGTRRRNTQADLGIVRATVEAVYREGDLLCSGGCPKGGDHFAEIIARSLGATIIIHHANWKKYGRGAGFVRNTKIAKDSDILVACVSPDRKGGTEHTITEFLKCSSADNLILV